MKYYNKKHKLQSYKIEDLVMLLIRNLQQKCLSWKLSHKFIRFFRIQNLVEKQTYWLSLSITYWIYNVFHIFYLKLYQHWWDNSSAQILQSLKLIDDTEKYKVEKIQDKKKTKEKVWYKIKWKSWPAEYNQWIWEEDMREVQKLHSIFNAKVQQKCSRKRKQ